MLVFPVEDLRRGVTATGIFQYMFGAVLVGILLIDQNKLMFALLVLEKIANAVFGQ